MSLQGPIVVVAEYSANELVQAFIAAGAFPVIESRWANACAAVAKVKPAAVVVAESEAPDIASALALGELVASVQPVVPVLACVRDDYAPEVPGAFPVPPDAPLEHIIARLAAVLRLRALHAAVLRRAATLKSERNIVAALPDSDPIDDATVLVVGRGRSHPVLSVAVGERMGVMGALSVDAAARCLQAREVDGIAIGEGLNARTVHAFLTVLAEDARFREMPIGILGSGPVPSALPNCTIANAPTVLIERMLPLVRMRSLEARLKRLLKSIECKGMLDVETGLLNVEAFGRDLARAIEDSAERGVGLSIARFSFDQPVERRASLDAARLISRLVREIDFACRQDDGSILAVFTETDLRHAHVVARRLASVVKHTMLQPDRERQQPIAPSVTLATLKPSDTIHTLLARILPRPVAAA